MRAGIVVNVTRADRLRLEAIVADRSEGGFFAKLTRRRLKRGVFRSVANLQAAINRSPKKPTPIPSPSSGPLTPNAPRWAPVEKADHPFILEFPNKSERLLAADQLPADKGASYDPSPQLNLLAGRTSLQPLQPEHFWACVRGDDESTGNYQRPLSRGFLSGVIKRWLGTWSGKNLRPRDAQSPEIKWVQQFYFAKLGEVVIDQLSPPAGS